MLTTADQPIVDRDTDLPGLAWLLDHRAFEALAQRMFSVMEITRPRPEYIRYKPGTSALVAYSCRRGDQVLHLYGKAFPLSEQGKLRKRLIAVADRHARRWVALDESLGIAVHCFPADPVLPGVTHLDGTDPSRKWDTWWGPQGTLRPTDQWHVVRYKPERRAVIRLDRSGEPWAAVRFYSQPDYARAKSSTKVLSTLGYLNGPRRIAQSDRDAALVLEWLPGAPLAVNMSPEALSHAAFCLARLHQTAVKGLPLLRPTSIAKALRDSVESVSGLLPELAATLVKTADAVCSRLTDVHTEYATVHGDFDLHQVLWDGQTPRFLDYDEAGLGPPALDLGNLWARMHVDRLLGAELDSLEPMDPYWDRFVESYRSELPMGRSFPTRETHCLAASGLLRMSVLPFRLRHPDWPLRTAHIVQAAAALATPADRFVRLSAERKRTPGSSPIPDWIGSTHGTGESESDRPYRSWQGISVRNATSLRQDTAFAVAHPALHPQHVERRVLPLLKCTDDRGSRAKLLDIDVRRHKPGRRCLIAYTWEHATGNERSRSIVLGKARARKFDRASFEIQRWLFEEAGFDGRRHLGSVPPPCGLIPEWQMWFQREQPGISADVALTPENDPFEAEMIAEALFRVHRLTPTATLRTHDRTCELEHLQARYAEMATHGSGLRRRLANLLSRLREWCALIPESPPGLVHRDFYPAQVVLQPQGVCLVDWDLAALGEPELDIGNFVAHLREKAIRSYGDLGALRSHEDAFVNRYCALAGDAVRPGIKLYLLLGLARHVYLSTILSQRHHTTLMLLEACEQPCLEHLGN